MFDRFFPDQYVASTYVIDFEKLYEEGVRGLIFDIDNTLVPHGAPADERAKALFARLKAIGFRCCLISNNQKPRVEMFNKDIQVDYVYNAHKPSTRNYLRAMEIMGTDRSEFCVYRRPAFYRCMGSKTCRNSEYSGKTDTSKGRNPDCFEALSGKNCVTFLQEESETRKKG